MLKHPEDIFGTTSVGTNIAVNVSVSVATAFLVSKFGARGDLYATLIMAPLILIVGEIIPKILFMEWADHIAHLIIYPVWCSRKLFSPILVITSKITNAFIFLLTGEKNSTKKHFITREDLIHLIKFGKKEIDIPPEEKKMIRNIFEFHESTVRECMVPLIDLVAISEKNSIDSARKIFLETNFSRLPVFKDRIYKICGVLHSRDLFLSGQNQDQIGNLVKPAHYVPETKRVSDLFKELQEKETHLAVVVDEYGGTIGIVTIEDMLEEIVGEIGDEHDDRENLYIKKTDNSFLIEARMEVDLLREDLKLNIPEGDYETIGGFLLYKFQKIPKQGESLKYENMNFFIIESSKRGIKKVKLDILDHNTL
jgi:CBS domain containing-hemolysin-like protein